MSIAWLRDLEERVNDAAERIRQLTEERSKLQGRVEELEEALEARPEPEDASAWEEERDEIRDRVTKLVEHLESLLPDDEE